MKEIIVGNNEYNKRLDSFLKAYLPNASMGFIYKMLRKKNITLNGKKADGTEKLSVNDSIKIFFADDTFEKFKGSTVDKNDALVSGDYKAKKTLGEIPVIFENDHIVLFNKPTGVLSQKAEAKDVSLNDYLIEYLLDKGDITSKTLDTYKPSICNRLDRNTSGIVICAKSLLGAREMNKLLLDRTADKYYMTIVSGRMDKPSRLKGYLFKDEKKNKVIIKENDPNDKRFSYIETEFKPIEYSQERDLTLIEVKLITGKTHQIRAHLSSLGLPIIGDVKYGGKKIGGLKSQLLHCYKIRFPKELPEELLDIAGQEYTAELPGIFKKFF